MSQTPETASLEVEGEAGVYWCARHKSVKTRLRCGRCETPICPKCMVMGPTGARCRDCASYRSSHIYQVAPGQFALAFGAALIFSALGTVIIGRVGLLLLFFAPALGSLLSQGIVRVTKGKRGTPLTVVASAGAILGALLPVAWSWLALQGALPPGVGANVAASLILPQLVYPLLYLALALPAIWYWLK